MQPHPVRPRPRPKPLRRHPIAFVGPLGPLAVPVAGTVTPASPSDFCGEGLRVELGDLSLVRIRLSPARYEHRPGMPDLIDVVYLLEGALRYRSPGGRRAVAPGTLVFSRPTRGDVLEIAVESTFVRVTMPAAIIPAEVLPQADLPMLTVPAGLIQPFVGVVVGVIGGPERCMPSTAAALEDAIIGMAEALLVEALGEVPPVAAVSLGDRARRYIDANLTDPRMGPDEVAAVLGVSARALHLAFENEELSVARYIQHRRLIEVDRALESGSLESVAVLARRFGFSTPDRLSRSFRAEFGALITDRRTAARSMPGQIR
jgi:AraC-like DNA-binding protein